MNDKIILQTDNYQNLAKARRNFKKSPRDRITEPYVQVRLEALEQLWVTFVTTHRQMYESYGEQLKQHDYVKQDIYDQAEEMYIDYKTELKTVLSSFVNSSRAGSSALMVEKAHVAPLASTFVLPKIIIPKFSGKYEEWVTFRDLFLSLVHKMIIWIACKKCTI